MIAVPEQTAHLGHGTPVILSIIFVESTGTRVTAQSIRAIAEKLSETLSLLIPHRTLYCLHVT